MPTYVHAYINCGYVCMPLRLLDIFDDWLDACMRIHAWLL